MPAHLFLGAPAVMGRLLRPIRQAAESDAGVLISGESGVGKELVARALHHYSPRCSNPWLEVNCAVLAALQPDLLKMAEGGTLFLDEIDKLSMRRRERLARLLHGAEVRVLAASRFDSDPLEDIIKIHFHVPALRERREDIGPLAELFLHQSNPDAALAPDARRALESYDWPENVRELRRVITSAAVANRGGVISARDLWERGVAA
jgi:DNA-binding NtrC family response regulator